ncbi:hypothetical protein [Pseudobacteriovorax antillogorgiicola]|uniref:DUF4198 domain-containing protein n=1 Tax=Pseudobacteriovorax antillogorgiicola TaxID=1513793 RepID=A0A1Y6CF74_9BACT|nr:hypothetical protein [Pseudobacteriovorax antillogorgiicola]TCS47607.1 hypothetical protein EDD56_12048 [Pseudobacteriovorax antillogorgiicola]SMF60102.1 hypothetical protein SAMN06296036_12092 [Pseudobacteriovorax antillogorgiicola]
MSIRHLLCIGSVSLAFSTGALASDDHDHDHGGEFDFDEFALVLEGQDFDGEACYLGIIEESVDKEGNTTLLVETSFAHGTEVPGEFEVVLTEGSERVLSSNENGSQFALFFDQDASVSGASQYLVRWPHDDHFHTDGCYNLGLMEL